MNTDSFSDAEISEFFRLKNVAVVGMSKTDGKAANYVPKYLIEQGYNVTPVNPTAPEIMGRKSYQNISSIPDRIDIVDVFRPSDDVLPVVMDVVKKEGIKVVWMQLGIYNEQAEKLAREKGIKVVYNRCMMEEHKRLFGK
jgi:predicted CoA-binding protein